MNKKLFAFDMDGTLLNSEEKILNETTLALKKARFLGHKTAIVTGRAHKDAFDNVDPLLFDYIVSNNGSYFYVVKENKFFYDKDLPKFLINHSIKIANENNCYIAIHGEKELKISAVSNTDLVFTNNEVRKELVSEKEVKEFGLSQKIMQITLITKPEYSNKIKDKFNDFSEEVDVCISNGQFIDINLKGINKWIGIQKIINHSKESFTVYSFGDSSNDLMMLNNSDFSYAMSNGNDEAKNAAKEIIGDNNSPAISKAILKNI